MSDHDAAKDFEATPAALRRYPHLTRETNPQGVGLTPFHVSISHLAGGQRLSLTRQEQLIVWAKDVLEIGGVLNHHYGHNYTDLTLIPNEERKRERGGYEW